MLPDYDVSLAPPTSAGHARRGLLLSPLGQRRPSAATLVLAFVFLGALGWLTFRLGEAWINPSAGSLAAAIVLTRRPVLDFGARAYVDLPYLALVLGRCSSRPDAGAQARRCSRCSGLAGLLRPEAWLFSVAYLAWLWIGGVRDPRLLALAAAAPLLWALGDLVVTGDPLHSLTGTRDTAQRSSASPASTRFRSPSPRRLGRDPARARPLRRRGRRAARARLPARARGARRGGRRGRDRRVLRPRRRRPADPRALPAAPAAILAIFCGAGAFGWAGCRAVTRGGGAGRGSASLTLVGLVAFIPAQVDRIGDLRDALARSRTRSRTTCTRSTPPPARARRSPVPNHRPVPLLALWLDDEPDRIAVAQEQPAAPRHLRRPVERARRAPSTSSTRATRSAHPAAARRLPAVAANASWRAFARCGEEGGPCTLLRTAPGRLRLGGSGTGTSRCAHRDPLKAASFRT